jgi:phosphoribosyl 1,2-cyclic phosphodiesterase
MRFCSLGSGSAGNATVVEARGTLGATRVLIDCGFSLRELDLRLQRADLGAADLDAVFVTHEHGDHIGSAVALARRERIPLWMSQGTWQAIGLPELDGLLNFARDGQAVAVGDLLLRPYTVPHDAREPLQLRCEDGERSLGVLTDAGSITAHLLQHLQRCDGLLLECNHDRERLAASRYPASLKARIGGTHGHLDNDTAASILAQCAHEGLRHVVAAHLSEQNNLPELARGTLAQAWGVPPAQVVVADQKLGCGWINLA